MRASIGSVSRRSPPGSASATNVSRVPPPSAAQLVIDREPDRAVERAQGQPPRRLVGDDLELAVDLAPHQAAPLRDPRALRQRAYGVRLDRAPLPLREALDVVQERENLLRRARDLDGELDPDHEVLVPASPRLYSRAAGR